MGLLFHKSGMYWHLVARPWMQFLFVLALAFSPETWIESDSASIQYIFLSVVYINLSSSRKDFFALTIFYWTQKWFSISFNIFKLLLCRQQMGWLEAFQVLSIQTKRKSVYWLNLGLRLYIFCVPQETADPKKIQGEDIVQSI